LRIKRNKSLRDEVQKQKNRIHIKKDINLSKNRESIKQNRRMWNQREKQRNNLGKRKTKGRKKKKER
jgi:hypothetical protein